MAIAAFKSTTKRVCKLVPSNELESASFVPLQPSSSFSNRGHRRSRSLSDFGSRYFSDSASAAGDANSIHLDSLFQNGRASSRHQSDDSESDGDSLYSRHTYRSRLNAEIGASRKAALQNGKTKGTPQAELRRSSSVAETSHKEISDFLRCLDDQSDSESVFTRLTAGSRRGDAQSDSESVFTRLTSGSRRFDAQSDSESVFTRLTRPRQTAQMGPPRARVMQDGKAKGTRAGSLRRSTSQLDLPSTFDNRDEHSETESLYSRQNSRSRQTADFGASRVVASRKKGTRQATLRRSSSQAQLSDSPRGRYVQLKCQDDDADSPEEGFFDVELDRRGGEDASGDHPAEEKTIRAVHTQNKEPRAQDMDAISLYDAMRVEMRKAVSDIRNEIEKKSVSKDLVLPTPALPGNLRVTIPVDDDDNDASVSEVRRQYADKLEQSEKRAQDLWTQLAAEERRCLDLVKFVKELLPGQPGSRPKPRAPPPMRPLMGPEVEKQLVSQSLDADAQRYFDECVSISGLSIMSVNDTSSCGVVYQESESPAWSVKDVSFSPRKDFGRLNEKKMATLEPLITFCAQIEQTGRCSSTSSNLFGRTIVNDDGLVLPWLKWETDLDFATQEQLGKDKKKDGSLISTLTASTRRQALTRSRSATWCESRNNSEELSETHMVDLPPGVSGLGCASNGDLLYCTNLDFGHLTSVAVSSTRDRGRSGSLFDVELFVLQRMWLRHRIKDGRILVCGGARF